MRERLLGAFGLGKPAEGVSEKAGPKEPTALHVEIGNSSYLLSQEAKKYLEQVEVSTYEKSNSILIIGEPHHNIETHLNLYKFLEVFFRDNPTLVPKTIFLAEGFPANQPISLEPLVEIDPSPSEEIIWEVLNTFLITGYMAYEWKYQHHIPIIGTEDPVLYQLSSRLSAILPESTYRLDLTKEAERFLGISNMARNKSIATTLIERAKIYQNPILFVGGTHLSKAQVSMNLAILSLNRGINETLLSSEETQHLRECQNLGISDYLKKEKIGHTFISTVGGPELRRDENLYRRLFQAQQTGNYEEYIARFVFERLRITTARPSPESAADFLKRYLMKRSDNSEAQALYKKGISSTVEGKYIEAAEEFSAASAADAENPGYVRCTQESLFKEYGSRITHVMRGSKSKNYGINLSVESDLPVIGPYIRKDHNQRVSEFVRRFRKTPGLHSVIENTTAVRHWETRFGGILQIDAAQILGPEGVRAFEEKHQLKEKGLRGGERMDKIDIATKNDIAIECKNFAVRPAVGSIIGWIEQSVTRFEPDNKGYRYRMVIIVIPNDKYFQEIEVMANSYLKLNYPELLGKIKICPLSELKSAYEGLKER